MRSSRGRAGWTHRAGAFAYGIALRAFPAGFRKRWGHDMRLTFSARLDAATEQRGSAPLQLIVAELMNVVATGLHERLYERLHGETPDRAPTTLQPHPHMAIVQSQDLRYAFRLLRRSPGFSLLTVLVLAGGLGLSTFTFSFLYTAMIAPLPLAEGERIVRVDPVMQGRPTDIDAVDVQPFRSGVRSIREIGAYTGRDLVVGHDGDRQVIGTTVTDPILFTVARVPAMLGRTLVESDAQPGAEPVVVLSYRAWNGVFAKDSAVLNSVVTLSGVSTRVVGIMPKGYGFPVASEAWMPLPATAVSSPEAGQSLRLVGRLAPGVPHEEATTEASLVMQRVIGSRDTTIARAGVAASVESFPSVQFGEERTIVFTVLNVLAALILLLALVNVTNLLLARANERIRETAVRMALGASTGRLIMQGMWETIILCVTGGLLGTAGAAWGLKAITNWTRANMEENLAFWWVWQMDGITLLCAGAFVTVAIATLGSVISLRTSRMNVREVIQDGSARAGSRRDGRLSRILVVTQVTTVTVLMFFGAVSAIIANRVMTLDPGFDTTRLLQGGVEASAERYPSEVAQAKVFTDVQARLADQGELEKVLLRRSLADPKSESGRFALRDTRATGVLPTANILAVLGDLGTVGVSVAEGRALDASDTRDRAPVVVISRSLATRLWNGRSPVGDQIRLAGVGDTLQFRTIVGVASDLLYGNPLSRDRSPDAIYLPLLQSGVTYSAFVVRYRSTDIAARQALMQAFSAVDPLLVPDTVQPLAKMLERMAMITLNVSKLFAACFAFALLLALVGTYGIMSRSIGLRTREIGVRRALGATDSVVTRLLLWQGGRQLGVGTLVAIPLLVGTGFAFRHFFPISGWLVASTGVIVSGSIVALVLATTWVPTRKTLRVALHEALRSE